MPKTVIKSFAEKSGKSESEVEKLWDKAKKITEEQYPDIPAKSDRFYKITIGVLKNLLDIKESININSAFNAKYSELIAMLTPNEKEVL